MVDLSAAALPDVEPATVRAELEAAWPMVRYLIGTEATRREPCALAAGRLVCDFFTLHGLGALTADPPSAPPGAAGETTWLFYLPVPVGAPFDAEEVSALGDRFRAGAAPDPVTEAAAASAPLRVDPDRLRGADR